MIKQYVLEWSQKSNNFHIQPLENLLECNQIAFITDKNRPDFIVLFAGSKEACHQMADNWRGRLRQREKPMTIKEAMEAAL